MIETLTGSITSVGFASGHRFVVGDWTAAPLGAMSDVMWAQPGGKRILLAPGIAADFVTSVYPFDEVRERSVEVAADTRRMFVEAGELRLSLGLSRVVLPFPPRPRLVTSTVENWCARALLGVRTFGVSPAGAREWYRTRTVRRIVTASGSLAGVDLGEMAELRRPLGFGFTDPPRRPCRVTLRVDLDRDARRLLQAGPQRPRE